MTASAQGRPPEDRQQLRRRTAERLRHKGRAILPADYERLVLERFPGIDRVKCFPNLSLSRHPDGSTCPGHVLVVALPPYESNGHMAVLPRLNGDLVAQVHDYLAERMAPGVTLEVANPFYQRIQVRCKVRLAAGVDHGWYVNMLDRLVSDHISPWNAAGNTSPFGWCIRQHDIEAALLAQPEVLGVSEFSMLSVSDAGSDRYLLTDTAVPGRGGRPAPDVTPLYPWSVAVPIRRHAILVAGSEQSRIATRTGIGKLEIGSTFIIPGEAQDGKAE
ncbi:baseplate J/gp47 family protein [Pseudoduganella armeniaca]|nr:baseplate J/gp47 family protein [Pseudoduganella armeniaca]